MFVDRADHHMGLGRHKSSRTKDGSLDYGDVTGALVSHGLLFPSILKRTKKKKKKRAAMAHSRWPIQGSLLGGEKERAGGDAWDGDHRNNP